MKNYFKISVLIIGTTFLFFFISSCGNSKGNKNTEQKDTVGVNSRTNNKTENNCDPKEIKENFFEIKKLEITGDLSIKKVLQKLFPGTLCYEEPTANDTSFYITWTCPACPKKISNYIEGEKVPFPYDDINETRSTNNDILFINDAGHETAIVPFSTCQSMGGRLQPGILGLAYFYKTPSGWSLKYFDPAINYGGQFGVAPFPKDYLKLNNNDWGCYTDDLFSPGAPAGGYVPIFSSVDVYGPVNDKLTNMLNVQNTSCVNIGDNDPSCSGWSSFFIVDENSNSFFNDLILVTSGKINLNNWKDELNNKEQSYPLKDFIYLLKNNTSAKNTFGFVMQRRYSFQKNSYSLTSTNIQTY